MSENENAAKENIVSEDAQKKEEPTNTKDPFWKNLALMMGVSFVMGFLASVIVIKLYFTFVSPEPLYYTFDLDKALSFEETKIVKNPQTNMKQEISQYMNDMNNYISSYSSKGMVFVSGAVIGKSPYVQDITKGFIKQWKEKE